MEAMNEGGEGEKEEKEVNYIFRGQSFLVLLKQLELTENSVYFSSPRSPGKKLIPVKS